MNLKINSWHAQLFKTVYNKSLPSNLCDYFWPVFFLSILGFFLWPIYIFLKSTKERWSSYFLPFVAMLFYMIYAMLLFTCLSTGEHNLDFAANAIWLLHTIGFSGSWMVLGYYLLLQAGVIALAIVIAAVVYTVIGIGFLWRMIRSLFPERKKKAPKVRTPNLLVEFIKAKKHKYCPRITWE